MCTNSAYTNSNVGSKGLNLYQCPKGNDGFYKEVNILFLAKSDPFQEKNHYAVNANVRARL